MNSKNKACCLRDLMLSGRKFPVPQTFFPLYMSISLSDVFYKRMCYPFCSFSLDWRETFCGHPGFLWLLFVSWIYSFPLLKPSVNILISFPCFCFIHLHRYIDPIIVKLSCEPPNLVIYSLFSHESYKGILILLLCLPRLKESLLYTSRPG